MKFFAPGLRLCGALALAGAAPLASAAWLGVCSAAPDADRYRVLAREAPGARLLVLADAALPGCTGQALGLPAAALVSGRFVPQRLAEPMARGFALLGRDSGERFEISDIVPRDPAPTGPAAPPVPGPAPADHELIGGLALSSVGLEGRAEVRHEPGGVRLVCGAGEQIAGALLRWPHRGLPRAPALRLALAWQAGPGFSIGVSDAARASAGDPLALGGLRAGEQRELLALPQQDLERNSVESFTLTCPAQAAQLLLSSVRLLPPPGPARAASRALWVWQASDWQDQPEALLEKARKAGADTLYLHLPLDPASGEVAQAEALAALVARAHRQGLRIWAVAGDPRAVLAEEREAFARLPQAYARYNQAVAAAARLDGLQFDIEPYLNPGYASDPVAWHEAYLDTLVRLKAAAGELPLDLSLPFWWANAATRSGRLLDRLVPLVQSVTVMNYRTDPAQIKRLAQPFLDWGSQHQRQVRIALEYGPIPDEVMRHYRPAPSGQQVLLALDQASVLLTLNTAPGETPLPASARVFAQTHETPVPGSTTTFAGRRGVLLKLLPELERLWAAWPSFLGTAIHEYEP